MHKREVMGIQANTVEHMGKNENGDVWRISPNEKVSELIGLKVGMLINRNRDQRWEQALTKKSAERRVPVWLTLSDEGGLTLTTHDEDGVTSSVHTALALEPAQQADKAEASLRDSLAKLGNTMFEAANVDLRLRQPWFVPSSVINALRRDAVAAHEAARVAAWPRQPRTPAVEPPVTYPETTLSYLANVYNSKATAFYKKHGVQLIAAAYEAHEEAGEVSLMITKHCLRFFV
jgi:putative protease